MAEYLVQLAATTGFTLEGGGNAVVVVAEDAADALLMAERTSKVDAADWANAAANLLVSPSDMLGWIFRVLIITPAGAVLNDFQYTGIASDALDDMGDGLTALANVPYTAAYNSTTQVITLATGTGTDDLGDHEVRAGFFPPGETDLGLNGEIGGIVGAISAVQDEGASNADLEVTLAADAWVVPSVPVLVKIV